MKVMFKAMPRTAAMMLVGFTLLLANSCSDKRITKANVNEITEGMAKKQVESILGQPTSIEIKDPLMKTTTYVYRQGKEMVTVNFKDDKVQSKESTLSE